MQPLCNPMKPYHNYQLFHFLREQKISQWPKVIISHPKDISLHISTSLLYNQFNKLEFGGEFRHAGFPALPPSQVRGARRLRRQCAKFQFEEQVLLRIKSLFLPAIRTILPFLYMKKAPVRALFSTKSTLTGEWNTASRCEIWLCHVKSLWRWVDFIAVKNGAVKKVPQQGSQCLKALATKN